jgi:7,8-dihydropterin-6-yl-methyl-4-(beta-D-ribofuranosyl)aminobenzene 5'-phosphate synthase
VVLFTGCSHAGVVNVSRHAVDLVRDTPLYCVVGGYHLADAEKDQIQYTINDVKALNPKVMIPGHCTGWRAKYKIEEEMSGILVPSFVGNNIVL